MRRFACRLTPRLAARRKASYFNGLCRRPKQLRAIGDPGSRRGRQSTPGLADGGRAHGTGRARPRRHQGRQMGRRRRHPTGHISAAAIVVACRPASAAPKPCCRFARSGRRMPGARTRRAATIISPCGSHGDGGGDRLTRADHLYDFIIEIDHNTSPRVAGRGSAVFLHLARPDFSPTAGCISMTQSAMLRLLERLGPQTRIVIG